MSFTHYDISDDPEAPGLVVVSERVRDEMRELGCKEAGYVGTVFPAARWSLVAQALSCPDPDTVAAIFSTPEGGDGVAFWSLFENGTVLTTEGDERTFRYRLQHFFGGKNPGDRLVVNLVELRSVKDIYLRHRELVKSVAARERTRVVEGDPFLTYLAVRIMASARHTKANRDMSRMMARLRFPLVVGPVVLLAIVGSLRRGIAAGLVFAALCAIPISIAMAFVAWWITIIITRRTHSPPPVEAAEKLLERASKVARRRWRSVLAASTTGA